MRLQADRDRAIAEMRADLLAAHLAPAIGSLNRLTPKFTLDVSPSASVEQARTEALERLRQQLRRSSGDRYRRSVLDQLWDEYSGIADVSADSNQARRPPRAPQEEGPWRAARRLFYSPAWVAFGLVFCTSAIYILLGGYLASYRKDVLQGFAVVALTLVPAFLYLRFARFRLDPVCEEYVYNLHRLKVDRVRNLPQPPRTSEAWQRWMDDGGAVRATEGYNVYEQKFRIQYGRWPSRRTRSNEQSDSTNSSQWYADTLGNLTVIYGCTALIGAGWATVVWTLPQSLEPPGPELADTLRFGFLGAYFYVLSVLMRRFFQNDLRPGAYLASIVRFITVLVLLVAVHESLKLVEIRPAAEYSIAFLVGVFPTIGMQLLRKAVSGLTRKVRGGLEPPMPLRQLDGMDIWTEARLLEVGIEDVQHLATTNMVDALLATRIPAQRLVDWVDQSLLLVHAGLPGIVNTNPKRGTAYLQLRRIGIRTASDLSYLVEALHCPLDKLGTFASEGSALQPLAKPAPDGGLSLLGRATVINIALCNDPNLRLVKNWQTYEQG